MFEKLSLSARLTGGFLLILALTSAVIGYSLWSVAREARSSGAIAEQVAPQVEISTGLERAAFRTVLDLRQYGFSMDDKHLESGRKNLLSVRKAMDEARAHAEKYPSLTRLKSVEQQVRATVGEYEGLVDKTATNVKEMNDARESLNENAQKYMAAADKLFHNQERALKQEIANRVAPEKLAERATKLILVTDLIEYGNTARVIAWKAQALRDQKLLQDAFKELARIEPTVERLRPITFRQEDREELDELSGAAKAYTETLRRYDGDMTESVEIGARRLTLSESVLASALSVSQAGVESTIQSSKDSSSSLSTLQVLVLIGLVLSVVIGLGLSWFITRQITLPINVIIQGLTSASEQVASASGQVASSSQQMAGGASQSASNLEEISSSLEEVTSMTRSNAENARRANEMAEKASSAATRGASGMERMSDAIGKIQSSASETAKIIKTIDEIAFQTNLLALNAAVEAARAGDAGKGFAVVAEEVRHLAMRSAEAAKTTSALIEESTRNAAGGVQVSQDVAAVLSEIVSNVQSVTKLVSDVAQASDQQAQGTQQVNTAMGQIDRITQANAANAEESASASEELSAQAVELNDFVDRLAGLVHGANHGDVAAAATPARRGRPAARAKAPSPAAAAKEPALMHASAPARASAPRAATPTPPPPPHDDDHDAPRAF